jgi:hypothetical protein
MVRKLSRTLRKVTLARGAPVQFRQRTSRSNVRPGTHHGRSRGRSPSRRPGCIHCAQPVRISHGPWVVWVFAVVRAAGWTYVVESAELGGRLVQAGVGGKDRAATLTLVPDNPTHGDGVVW